MAERVIFEFRAGEDVPLGGFEFRCGERRFKPFGPSMWACCHAAVVPQRSQDAAPKRSQHNRRSASRHLRETLDIFQSIYDDLYGEEDPDPDGEPEPH